MTEKAIIITGASRGIGATVATTLARAGFIVGCLSRSGALPVSDTLSPQDSARLVGIEVDITDFAALRQAIDNFAASHTMVGLINNAGLHTEARSSELTLEAWDHLLAVNATATMIGCQAIYPHISEKGGLIINIGSFFEKLGVKRNLAYCASKAAVGAITRVLAVEWATQGIRVLNIAPGYILTDLNRAGMEAGPLRAYLDKRIPASTPGTPEDVADLVHALFSHDLKFLTGETIYIDGGQGIAH